MAATAGRTRRCTARAQELLVLGWMGAARSSAAQDAHRLPRGCIQLKACCTQAVPRGPRQAPHRSSAFMAAFCALFFSAAISSDFCTQWVARWLGATRRARLTGPAGLMAGRQATAASQDSLAQAALWSHLELAAAFCAPAAHQSELIDAGNKRLELIQEGVVGLLKPLRLVCHILLIPAGKPACWCGANRVALAVSVAPTRYDSRVCSRTASLLVDDLSPADNVTETHVEGLQSA